MASSSLSNAEYLVSAECSLREKKHIGVQTPAICCCKTAPTAVSDASVRVSAVGDGCANHVAAAKAYLLCWKCFSCRLVQAAQNSVSFKLTSSYSGSSIAAACGTKRR